MSLIIHMPNNSNSNSYFLAGKIGILFQIYLFDMFLGFCLSHQQSIIVMQWLRETLCMLTLYAKMLPACRSSTVAKTVGGVVLITDVVQYMCICTYAQIVNH